MDQISELPDAIIRNILFRLPTKNVVQTSLVSKKWRYHWTFNPNFDLDLYFYSPTDIVPIINHFIDSYKGTHLRTFRLIASPWEDITKEVTKWVDFAVDKQVSVLDIAGLAMVRQRSDRKTCSYFDPPESLFSCDSIESLSLNSCVFIPPMGFKGFSHLKTLYLGDTRIREETVGQVLSKCPLLESLTLYEPESIMFLKICAPFPRLSYIGVVGKHMKGIEISAPGLQFLDITGNPETLLVSAPRLVKAQFPSWLSVRGSGGDLTVEALRDWASTIAQFSNLLALMVGMHFLMLLYADCYMNERNPRIKFEFLKVFHVMGDLDETYGVSAIVSFLRDCPSLRSVIIGPQPRLGVRRSSWVCEYMKMEQVQPIIVTDEEEEVEKLGGGVVGSAAAAAAAAAAEDLSDYDDLVNLKTITMIGFSGSAREMKLVKFLLQKAVALDILDLQWEPFCHSPAVMRELVPLAAKSSHAEIKELVPRGTKSSFPQILKEL